MREWTINGISILENGKPAVGKAPAIFTERDAEAALSFHRKIEGYRRTPLLSLPGLARRWGVRGIYVKDESERFSLSSFKGLGGSYAMFRIICERLGLDPEVTDLSEITSPEKRDSLSGMDFVTCTDGNHGRGVSWAAGLFGTRAHVLMPKGSEEVRAEAIRNAGPAEVTITDVGYDDTVKIAREMSEKHGWILIQDTSWKGYETVPSWIIQGYLTMAKETADALESIDVLPTHLFLQAGVGAMAGGVISYFADRLGQDKPVVTIVEPKAADCVYRSVKAGRKCSVESGEGTIMAGLDCGTPCSVTFPVIKDHAEFFISGPDRMAEEGMRAYAEGTDGDRPVVSGGSGAATLGAAKAIMEDPLFSDVKSAMGIDAGSILLFINTEGATDPENYQRTVGNRVYNIQHCE